MGILIIILLAILLIARLSKIIKMLKDPQVLKGIGLHCLFFFIWINLFISADSVVYDAWEKEQDKIMEVTQSFLQEKGIMDEKDDPIHVDFYVDRYLSYEEKEELAKFIEEEVPHYEKLALKASNVFGIASNLVLIIWIILLFKNKPMKKAGILILSIISLGFLFIKPDSKVDTSESSTTFVDPHYVSGYEREDGTYVDGYWRDGDGDTSINRTVEEGGGYWRSNPDGNPHNNLKS
jgi:tryptophan-rich sensory protein